MKTPSIITTIATAIILTGTAGIYFALPSGKQPATEFVGTSPANTASPNPLNASEASANGNQHASGTFAELPEHAQITHLTRLLDRATDADIQQFSDLIQSVSDGIARVRLLATLDRLAETGAVEMVASFLRITTQPDIIAAVQRTLERAAQPETAVYLAEMATEAGRPTTQRQFALEALSMIRNPIATEGLRDVVTTFLDDETAGAALASLGKLRSTESVESLVSLFDRLPPERFAARHAVIGALKSSSSAESISLLEDLAINHAQPLLRQAATDALQTVTVATQG